MANLVMTIVLSSGTTVQIPAFTQVDGGPRDSFSRMNKGGAVLTHYAGSIQQFQKFNDADMLELGNILTNSDNTALSITPPSVAGQWCGFLFWYYDNGEWYLAYSFNAGGTTMDITLTHMGGGYQDDKFFNGENPQATEGNHYYFDDAVNDAPTWYAHKLYNAKSGSVYSLEIASNTYYSGDFVNHRLASVIASNVAAWMTAHPNWGGTVIAYDPESNDDPFIVDEPSQLGGGNGDRGDPDEIEKATIPPLPSLSAVDTGLITMYGATLAQLQSLGMYLWSDLWDIETNFKKLFADPMNCLIGLSIVPVIPSMGGATNVKFGNITTNIALNKLTSQWAEVDCGTVSIREYIGCFLDYSPYVNISIYLPYIGYRELSPDDVMNESIHVVYHIDVLTGGCCAFIECGSKGLLYSFNGSCIADVPITAINYSGAIQNAVSAVGSFATTAVGIATGAAPVAAMGAALSAKNIVSGVSNAANTAMQSKPSVQRSGNMGGSAGLMSYQRPMIVITRPRMSVPDKLNKFAGLTTNVTLPLSTCKGFTQVELIHLTGIPCTDNERDELLTLLHQGVIF